MHGLKQIIAATAVLVAVGARADFTAADALVCMPAELRGTLGAQRLADLVEYARAGMLTHTEKTAADSEARICVFEPERIVLQTDSGRTLTLQLLPAKTDTVVAVIETLTSLAADSRMTVYSRTWTPQPKLWQEPAPSRWGKVEPLPVLMVEYDYSPETGVLTLTNNSEERDKMVARLRYRWTPAGFKLIKE